MSEIDQQFIEYVVKSLVGKPDAVHIDRRVDEKGVLLELTVDPEDLGRVIGKRGATAQSLRTLLRALGTKNDARYNLKIIDNGACGPPAASADDSTDQPDDKKSDEPEKAEPQETQAAEPAEPEAPAETEPEAPEPEEKPSEPAEPEEAPASHDDGTTDRLSRTRKELADLDDLDL